MKIGEYEVTILDNNTVKVGCVTVSRYQMAQVFDLMQAWKPPAPKFQIGDFVRVLNTSSIQQAVGKYGRVASIQGLSKTVGVEFAERLFFSSADGAWFLPENLEKVD